jgi:nicotinate-nucleotide adenylyltransferase
MSTLEKIIYVADYMEPNRDFPGVEQLRQLAYADLDKAMLTGLEMTVENLRQRGLPLGGRSREAIADLKMGKDQK